MKALVETLNAVGENVWAVVIIAIAALLAVGSIWHHELLNIAGIVAGIGGTAFKGGAGK